MNASDGVTTTDSLKTSETTATSDVVSDSSVTASLLSSSTATLTNSADGLIVVSGTITVAGSADATVDNAGTILASLNVISDPAITGSTVVNNSKDTTGSTETTDKESTTTGGVTTIVTSGTATFDTASSDTATTATFTTNVGTDALLTNEAGAAIGDGTFNNSGLAAPVFVEVDGLTSSSVANDGSIFGSVQIGNIESDISGETTGTSDSTTHEDITGAGTTVDKGKGPVVTAFDRNDQADLDERHDLE